MEIFFDLFITGECSARYSSVRHLLRFSDADGYPTLVSRSSADSKLKVATKSPVKKRRRRLQCFLGLRVVAGHAMLASRSQAFEHNVALTLLLSWSSRFPSGVAGPLMAAVADLAEGLKIY
jgi:hypothetical protein